MQKKRTKRKNSALAAFFQGLGEVVSAFDAAAATRKDTAHAGEAPAGGSISGVQNGSQKPQGDCGGCK